MNGGKQDLGKTDNSSVDQSSQSASRGSPQAVGERKAVAAAAFVFGMGTLASRILGLIRDRMTAQYFSPEVRDAFVVAFRLPNMFRRILGEGALSVSMIPVLVDLLTKRTGTGVTDAESREHFEASRRLVGALFTLLLSLTLTLTALAVIFMDQIIGILVAGEGYMSIPGKFELTVLLARIMFGFLILITLYAFFMAILNSLKKFALAAVAPVMFNISMISAALLSKEFGAPEKVLAWSVVVGGGLQMAILIPAIIKEGYWPKLSFVWRVDGKWVPFWRVPEVQRVFTAMAPSIFGLSILQFSAVIRDRFASELPQGSHWYLYCADRILELPLALFTVSVGTAVLPTLSAQWSRGDKAAMTSTLDHAIRLIGFVALPSAIGMFFLAQPITEVLFLGGQFKYQDVLPTAEVIQVYSFTLLFAASTRILNQGFYSMGNTWYPALVGVVTLVIHFIFSWVGTKTFGLKGLAAASIISGFVNLIMLAVAYSRWVAPLGWMGILGRYVRFAVGGVALAFGCMIYEPIIEQFGSRFFTRTPALILAILVGGGLYMFVAKLMKLEEYEETTARVFDKILRKIRGLKKT